MMVVIQVCVGSSCYIKGASDIIQLLENKIADLHLEDRIVLSGSFCTGKCNRIGVTITVNDVIYTGITKDTFTDFWNEKVVSALKAEGDL